MALAAAGETLAGTPSFHVQTSLTSCLSLPWALPASPRGGRGRMLQLFPLCRGREVSQLSWGCGYRGGSDCRHRSLALLRQKAELLAYLPPCQLMTLPGGSPPSGQLSLEASCMSAGTSPGLLVSVVPF